MVEKAFLYELQIYCYSATTKQLEHILFKIKTVMPKTGLISPALTPRKKMNSQPLIDYLTHS